MNEVWVPCPGFINLYEVSNLGRVRRASNAPRSFGTRPGKLLKPWCNNKCGHLMVSLRAGNRTIKKLVHVLVCEAWNSPRPSTRHRVAHYDGNGSNNRIDNLRWATYKENEQDKIRHGRYNHAPNGSRHRDAKLTEADIPIIRALRKSGLSYSKIAARFGIDWSSVRGIIKGHTWKHVS
jgi:hypothetical protein